MRRRIVVILVQAVVAALALLNIVGLKLETMMRPTSALLDTTTSTAVWAIALITIAVIAAVFYAPRFARMPWLAVAVVATLLAGFAPSAVRFMDEREAKALYDARGREAEAKMLQEIEARRQDVDARVASKRPYSPDELLEFVDLLRRADLHWAGFSDHAVELMPILQRALEARIVDPNMPVKRQFTAEPPTPLFLHFYRTKVRRSPTDSIEARDWRILLLLAGNGADLSIPGAEPVAADLRKKVTPLHNGLYVQLD